MSHEMSGDAKDGDNGFLILILLIVLLLGGIGMGGYWVLSLRRQQAAVQAEMQAMEGALAAQEAAAAQQKAKAP